MDLQSFVISIANKRTKYEGISSVFLRVLTSKLKLQQIYFLDVTFNFKGNTYRPYRKPNDNLTHINTSSNHEPPHIIKHLTQTISERLSQNF